MHDRRSTPVRHGWHRSTVAAAVLALAGVHGGAHGISPAAEGDAPSLIDEARPLEERAAEHFGLIRCTVLSPAVEGQLGGPIRVSVPIRGKTCTLELQPHSVRAADFQLAVYLAGYGTIPIPAFPVRTYRGGSPDLPGTAVAASLMEDGLHAMIVTPADGLHWLQPLDGTLADAEAGQYVLYDDEDVVPSGGACNVLSNEPDPTDEHAGIAAAVAGAGTCIAIADLAAEADYRYFESYGSVGAVQSKIEAVINTTNLQYERDVEITHQLTGLLVRVTAESDPYTSTSPSELLTQFRAEWRLTPPLAVARDVTHLFTGRELDGSVIGVAWGIGMMCTTGAYCLAQSDCCSPNLACAADLTAHELGHLWGAYHCTCNDPAYTMNDFITCVNRFSPLATIPDIAAHRDSRSCLANECAPANDRCVDAEVVTNGDWPFSTEAAATDGPAESTCGFPWGDSQLHADVWFRYDATCNGTVTAGLCGASYDTRMAVYEASCPFVVNSSLACNDNSCYDASRVTFTATAGLSYYIRVGGVQGQTGSGTLSIACAPSCPTDVNNDTMTDVDDLMAVILAWGTTDQAYDVNASGLVDVDDLLAVLAAWGGCD